MPQLRDPEGGLTEAGRRKFERSGESKNLQPGVKESSPSGERARCSSKAGSKRSQPAGKVQAKQGRVK